MKGGAGGGGARYYRRWACKCGGVVRAEAVESLAWAQVVRIFREPGAVLAEIRSRQLAAQAGGEAALRLEQVEAAIATIPAERERASLQHQEGYLNWETARARMDDLDRRMAGLEAERARLVAQVGEATAGGEQATTAWAMLYKFGRRLGRLTVEERTRVVRGFIERVTVDPGGAVTVDGIVPSGPARGRVPAASTPATPVPR